MKQLLMIAICTTALLGCNSEQMDSAEPTTKLSENGITINENNAPEIISLLDELDVYTALPATLSYNETSRKASNTSSECIVSGNINVDTQSDSNSSLSIFSYDNCSYIAGHSINGSYTTASNFEEDLSTISIKTQGKLENTINEFATMMHMDVDIYGSKELYQVDYRFDFVSTEKEIAGEFIVYTNPTLIWDENNDSLIGSIIIEGADNNKLELLYNTNGVTYYLNGQLYTP
ncbi:hypothetical protein [Psychromonas sp. Urea-02u-13]|uniref:hypothetical protein n=1 Tax=Psychromonas sp. Urea-02u-13 TaxID=2058326 RepID=UPI000CACD043|nr:hypothetical protein [Psychromonas sp. Urea-02u-13]PKG39163.1 hypothetical protein CXF74_09660 [Psychromonas sp. Urea-02u-13]